MNHELVAQAFVYGDSLQATLVAIIVPDETVLLAWASKNALGDKTFEDLCKSDAVKKHMLQAIQQHGKLNGLKGFENIKNLFLENVLFSVENDLLVMSRLKIFDNNILVDSDIQT